MVLCLTAVGTEVFNCIPFLPLPPALIPPSPPLPHPLPANQETVVELISFFQRALPLELLSHHQTPSQEPPEKEGKEEGDRTEKTLIQQVQ